jgi:hypothetical protein
MENGWWSSASPANTPLKILLSRTVQNHVVDCFPHLCCQLFVNFMPPFAMTFSFENALLTR